ncbi:hypothetical protein D3C80_2240940 [compost metagenome]
MVDMAWENRLELATGSQLQAVQGRRTEEAFADDARAQFAVWRMDNVVRAQ